MFAQHVVAEAMRNKVYVDAGAEGCLGRLALAYPKRDEVPTWRAVTRPEADAAVRRCGLEMAGLPAAALRPYPLTPRPDEKGVTVNPNADNGFPVLGKWNTPGAAALAMGLARTIRDEIDSEGNGESWLRRAEQARPWLVAVRGKAKADYYPQEKVVEARMRFYNAFPRQTMLVMQQATQVLELNARHYLNSESYSGIGVSLVHGGAADLVREMDRRLARDGFAYVHVGDDSWVVVCRDGRLAMFALDCSNFDLTQRAEVTLEVHASIRRQLRLIDPRASELWHGYARQRLVVVSGSLVRMFKHAGPSGMPLQSKINDVLMDVMLNRLLGDLHSLEESEVARAVEATGQSMWFSVRLEQYWSGSETTLLGALEVRPFLFIGYYFHVREGGVQVCADIPRTMAQLPYPALKWSKEKRDLQITEAMRLGSVLMSMGMPTRQLEGVYSAFRTYVEKLLKSTIELAGDISDERLRWAVQESPWGPPVEASLMGLLRAVRRDPAVMWLGREAELPATSTLVPLSWADQLDEEEEEEAKAFHAVVARPGGMEVPRRKLPPGRVPTHPATRANDGRPPPTVVWAPDRAPAPRRNAPVSRKDRRAQRTEMRQDMYQGHLDFDSEESDFDEEWGYHPY